MLRSFSDTRASRVAALAGAVVLLSAFGARAHDWYPWECCSGHDCAPIPLKDMPVERNGGFELIDGRHISYKDLKPSPDGQWHLCEQKWPAATKDRKILCLYAPIGGV